MGEVDEADSRRSMTRAGVLSAVLFGRHDVQMAFPLLVTVDINQLDEARIERVRSVIRGPFELACISRGLQAPG